jgi:predicted transcriptional regulator
MPPATVTTLSQEFTKNQSIKSELKAEAKLCMQKSKEMKKSSKCISDDTKCPIHPLANHTWGECYLNAANKNKPKPNGDKAKKHPEKTKKDKVDGCAAHLANDDVSIMLLTTAHGTLDSLSTMLEPCRQQAVNNNLTVLTINNSMFAQLCLDLNHQVDDPNALVAKCKAARAAETDAEVNNGTYIYDGFYKHNNSSPPQSVIPCHAGN